LFLCWWANSLFWLRFNVISSWKRFMPSESFKIIWHPQGPWNRKVTWDILSCSISSFYKYLFKFQFNMNYKISFKQIILWIFRKKLFIQKLCFNQRTDMRIFFNFKQAIKSKFIALISQRPSRKECSKASGCHHVSETRTL